jgi:hypothetical protein
MPVMQWRARRQHDETTLQGPLGYDWPSGGTHFVYGTVERCLSQSVLASFLGHAENAISRGKQAAEMQHSCTTNGAAAKGGRDV